MRSLRDEVFLSFPRSISPGLHDLIMSACRSRKLLPNIAQEATQLQTIIGLVCTGLGVAIVPASMVRLQRAGVVYRPFLDPMPRVQTLMVWRKETSYPALKRLIALAKTFEEAESR
jgi:DNA-binding transcriptional LysR family regulator